MAVKLSAGFPRPFGPYLLIESFGRGGMGEVFLAKRHEGPGQSRFCVVKTLRSDLNQNPSYVRRFLDEARVVVQLDHENVCAVLDAGKAGDEYFLTMEYIAGANLRDLLVALQGEGRGLDEAAALYVGSELLHALAYAHALVSPVTGEALRVIHRDVSPHNVMVAFDGGVKLIDFGLAESAIKQEQTESAVVMGKVGYMSPEQARGVDVDATCDQFAAAVVIYEALVGDRFYGDMSIHQIWQIVGYGDFLPRRWQQLDPALQDVLGRALAADPEARWPSCEAFRAALDGYRRARGLDGGRAELTATLSRAFADRIAWDDAVRRELALAPTPVSDPHAALRQQTPVDLHVSRETTMSARTLPNDLTLPSSPPTMLVRRATGPLRPPRRARAPLAAALGIGAAAALLAAFALRPDAPAPSTSAAPPSSASPSSGSPSSGASPSASPSSASPSSSAPPPSRVASEDGRAAAAPQDAIEAASPSAVAAGDARAPRAPRRRLQRARGDGDRPAAPDAARAPEGSGAPLVVASAAAQPVDTAAPVDEASPASPPSTRRPTSSSRPGPWDRVPHPSYADAERVLSSCENVCAKPTLQLLRRLGRGRFDALDPERRYNVDFCVDRCSGS